MMRTGLRNVIRFIIETTPLPSHCIDSCRYTITFMKNSESRNCRSHNSDHTKPRMRLPPLLMLCFPLRANALLMPLSSHCYPVLLSQLDNTMPGEYLDQNREDPVSLVNVHAYIKPSVPSLTQSLLLYYDHTEQRMRSPPLLMLCCPIRANARLMSLSSHCYPVLLSQLDNITKYMYRLKAVKTEKQEKQQVLDSSD